MLAVTPFISPSKCPETVGLTENVDRLGSEKEGADFLPPGNRQHSPSNSLSRWPQPRTQ